MDKLIITIDSGISADGFSIEVPGKFNETYSYGYNASWKRAFAEECKPYTSDIIAKIMNDYNISLENVFIVCGDNTFTQNKVSQVRVEYFINTYLNEIK